MSVQTEGDRDSAVESLSDTESVKGLGETTDFLNMVRLRTNNSTVYLSFSPTE